jgi:hypothetical protein
MARIMFPILIVALLATIPVHAQESKNEKLQGTWVLRAKDHKTTIEIKPDVLRCTVVVPEEGCTISVSADYVLRKDGTLIGVIRAKPAGADNHHTTRMKEQLFSCHVAVHKNSLVINGMERGRENPKEYVEGVYRKVKDKEPAPAAQAPPTMTPVLPGATTRTNDQSSIGSAIGTFFTKVGEFLGMEEHYSPDPRMMQLMNQTEDLRVIEEEWANYWLTDHASHLTPEHRKPRSDPNRRMKQLMNQSEFFGPIERKPLKDHPSHLTPERVDGAIKPH